MLVGDLGRLGAPRIDDDDAPAAIPNGARTARHVRGGHETAVRHHGVGTDDQEVVGPVEIRDGNQGEMPEHPKRGEHLRQLIGRARYVEHLAVARRRRWRAPAPPYARARRRLIARVAAYNELPIHGGHVCFMTPFRDTLQGALVLAPMTTGSNLPYRQLCLAEVPINPERAPEPAIAIAVDDDAIEAG